MCDASCDWHVSRGHSEAIVAQHSLLQLACAVLQSLEGEAHAHWELLCSVEKVGHTHTHSSVVSLSGAYENDLHDIVLINQFFS